MAEKTTKSTKNLEKYEKLTMTLTPLNLYKNTALEIK